MFGLKPTTLILLSGAVGLGAYFFLKSRSSDASGGGRPLPGPSPSPSPIGPVPTPSPAGGFPKTFTVVNAPSGLAIRSGASQNYNPPLGILSNGTKFVADSMTGVWAHGTAGGKTGWSATRDPGTGEVYLKEGA